MKTYICKQPVELSRKDFDKINKLFKVDFDDESPEMEALINELDARPNTIYCSFWWEFEDGNTIRMDIESDDVCYIDNTDLFNDDDSERLESAFSIEEEMKFPSFDGDRLYICKIQIKENDDKGGDNMEKKKYLDKLLALDTRIRIWLDMEYVPKCMKDVGSFKSNSMYSALVLSWFDAIRFCIDYFADGTYDEDDMPFDVDNYLEFFNNHTLEDCATMFLSFRHPEAFDVFGFSDDGFVAQIETLNTVIEEIKKEDNWYDQ